MKLRIEPNLFVSLPKDAVTLNDPEKSLFECYFEEPNSPETIVAFSSFQLFVDSFVQPYFLKRYHDNKLMTN